MGEGALTKGDGLASIDVEDAARNTGRFLVRSGKAERVEGQARKRLMSIEFPDARRRSPATARSNTPPPRP